MKKRSIAGRLGIAALALTLITTSLSSGTLAKYTSTFSATGVLEIANWNVGAYVYEGDNLVQMSDGTTECKLEHLAQNAYILTYFDVPTYRYSPNASYSKPNTRLTHSDAQAFIKGSDTAADASLARIAPGTEGYIGIMVTTNDGDFTTTPPWKPSDVANYASQTEVSTDFTVSVGLKEGTIPNSMVFDLVEIDGTTVTPLNAGAAVTIDQDPTHKVDGEFPLTDIGTYTIDPGKVAGNTKTLWVHWVWPYDVKTEAGVSTTGQYDPNDTAIGKAALSKDLTLKFKVEAVQTMPKITQ